MDEWCKKRKEKRNKQEKQCKKWKEKRNKQKIKQTNKQKNLKVKRKSAGMKKVEGIMMADKT